MEGGGGGSQQKPLAGTITPLTVALLRPPSLHVPLASMPEPASVFSTRTLRSHVLRPRPVATADLGCGAVGLGLRLEELGARFGGVALADEAAALLFPMGHLAAQLVLEGGHLLLSGCNL